MLLNLKISFTNIIFNAIDALRRGGKIKIRDWADDHSVHTQIIDNGIGMSPEVSERIFEPYFTTERPLKSGLGLSEAYGTIKKHGGDISIESEAGKGTTVEVTLPIAATSPTEADDKVAETGEKKPPRPGGKILIIDDDRVVLNLLERILSRADYQVSTNVDSRLGLQQALQGGFNLVITDLRMAEIDGLELARRIKEKSSGTKIALITGWEEAFYQSAIKESGIDAVWEKPFTAQVILEEVSKLIPV